MANIQAASQAEELSIWNQAAVRFYMRLVVCFAVENHRHEKTATHLDEALQRLAKQRTDLSGMLEITNAERPGRIYLRRPDPDLARIEFEVVPLAHEFGYTYDELKAAEFPPAPFIHNRWSDPYLLQEGGPPVPVCKVIAYFIDGGLLLTINMHHSLGDGECMHLLQECFAGQTRRVVVDGPSSQYLGVSEPSQEPGVSLAESLARNIPEYNVLHDRSGPAIVAMQPGGTPVPEIPRSAKTFVFRDDRLSELRALLAPPSDPSKLPSAFCALTALCWAHIAAARLRDVDYSPGNDRDKPAKLPIAVNWKRRVAGDAGRTYFGNATAISLAKLPIAALRDACTDMGALAAVVREIEGRVGEVDEGFVERRTAFFQALPDPRMMSIHDDMRIPQNLVPNSWRRFGMDHEWDVSGDGRATTPDAIRRGFNFVITCLVLFLPARSSSTEHHLMMNLSTGAMDLLARDEGWMRWVDRVVG